MNAPVQEQDYLEQLDQMVTGLKRWRSEIEQIMRRYKSLYTFSDIVISVIRGERLFLHAPDAFIIAQSEPRSLGLRVHVYAAGGTDKAALLVLAEQLETIARSFGAVQLTAMGRKGFLSWAEAWGDTGQAYFVKEL